MKTKFTLLLLFYFLNYSWSQTIFNENMGSPSGNTAISANIFQNSSSLTYSNGQQTGSADVRITSPSSGYSGSTGLGNIYFSNTSGAYGFSIEGINASNYTSLSLQYSYKKEAASIHATFSVDYWNGTSWIILANTSSTLFNEVTNASAIWYSGKTLSLPTDAQINGLKIRFVKTGTTAIRIDDVKLTGIPQVAPTVVNSNVTDVTFNSTTFGGNVNATGGGTIASTGTIYAVASTNSNPTIGGLGVVTLNTPSPNNGIGTFSNSSGAVLLYNVLYSYNAFAIKSSGAIGYGTVGTFYTLAGTPEVPIATNITSNAVTITLGSDANSSITTYAILETTTNTYVQSNGTLGILAVYQTAAGWGNKVITGLNSSTTYNFKTNAKNGDGILTQPSAAITVTTTIPPNTISDIVFNSSSTTSDNTNIIYTSYQVASITSTVNSVGVMGFYLRDGGLGLNDADNLATELTAISFTVANGSSIRSARLFVGNSPKGISVPVVNGVISFSGLTGIIAGDNSQLPINLRVTFKSSVTDNQQLQFVISSAIAKSAGSGFAQTNAGGASSSIVGDINRIEVTASKLAFLQQPQVNVDEQANMIPYPSVSAIDNYGNKDVDFTNNISITSSGTLTNSPQTVTAIQGIATFSAINHIVPGIGLFLSANSSGLSEEISSSFNVLIIPTFEPFYTYVENSPIPDLPLTSLNGIIGTWAPAIDNTLTTTYTFTPNAGQNSANKTSIITIVDQPYGLPLLPVNNLAIPYNQTCLVTGINVTCISQQQEPYYIPNPTSNSACHNPPNQNALATTLPGNGSIIFNFAVPITSVKVPFYGVDNFTDLYMGLVSDKAEVIINSPGQLSFTNLCGLINIPGNILKCTLPVRPAGAANIGNAEVVINSTIPFTTLTIHSVCCSGWESNPCDLSNIITCLAGNNAPTLSTNSITDACPATTINLTSITATNQPPNTTLTWHSSNIANGTSLVNNPSSALPGTYYGAFYDAAHNCYSPISLPVNATITCTSDLSVTKSLNNSNTVVNNNVTFTITATNNGPNPATGVIVTDNLPSGYTLVSASPSTGSWSSSNWTIGNLANGASTTLTLVAKVGCGNYINTATITGNQTDSNLINNTSSATVSPIIVINASNDDFSVNPMFTCTGGQTASVYTNDTLACSLINSSTVLTSLINNGGATGATINNNGLISIPSNTPVGTYLLTYSICEILNPSNCDTAQVKIVVKSTIDAIDDNFSSFPINTITGGNTQSIFNNDMLNGIAINPTDITFSFVGALSITGATINSLGAIIVPPNTPVGTYNLTYQIYQNSCPLNFDTASITIYVSNSYLSTPNISNSIRANNLVNKIDLQSSGKIIISGLFNKYNNIPKNYLARLNTDLTLDTSFTAPDAIAFSGSDLYNANPNDFVIQPDNKIIVVTDTPYSYGSSAAIVRLNPDGDIDPTFVTGVGISQTNINEGYGTGINACAIQPDGKILIGGRFDTYNGTTVRSMIRLNTDGSIDPTFTFHYSWISDKVNQICLLPNGEMLVSGHFFTTVPAVATMKTDLVKLLPNGDIDPTFTQGFFGPLSSSSNFNPQSICVNCSVYQVQKILVQPSDGKILIAGSFDNYNGTPTNCIVRLLPNGNIDPNFNLNAPGANRVIYDLDLETPASATSDIIFCGEFTTYNGGSVKKMARMHSNGSIDTGFNIGTGTLDSGGSGDLYNYIKALKRQDDGKIIVGGKFTSFNGITAGNITRIQGNNGTQAKNTSIMYMSEPEININIASGNVKVYPNPVKDNITIDLTEDGQAYTKIILYNLLGEEVFKSAITSGTLNQIDIANLPSGYYFAKITNENTSIQVKLIKE
jgi:uncharacterized repeat protein (TIGR01451 family)/uncharacterized delta-60 repeat protein